MASRCSRGGLSLDIWKNFFSEGVRCWDKLLRAVFGSPPLKVFKRRTCGTWGHGLVTDLAVLGDSVVSQVLSQP